ncbi:MAG: hypothetical protein ACFFD2_03985 [Promethearchaeota archaeon]
MTKVKYTTSAKILKALGYIFMGAAIILIMLGFSGLWMGTIPGLNPIWMLVCGFLLFVVSVPLLALAQAGAIKPEFDSIALLKCTNTPDCKFSKGRKFEKDEYVFKELDEKCKKCNNNLYIASIIEVERTSDKEKKEEKTKAQEESWNIKEPKTKE